MFQACNRQISSKRSQENKNTIDNAVQGAVSGLQNYIRIVSQHHTKITIFEDLTLFLSPDSQELSFKVPTFLLLQLHASTYMSTR